MFLLPEACSQNHPKAAVLQMSLQVPGDSGCKATCAWVLMAPALLLLEVAMVKGVVFFPFIHLLQLLYLLLQKELGSRNACKRQRHLPVQPARQSAQTPLLILLLEYGSVISKEMPALPRLCKHRSRRSIGATLSCELIYHAVASQAVENCLVPNNSANLLNLPRLQTAWP